MRITKTSLAKTAGFTLTDTLVAVVIMACVLCLAIPLFAHGASTGEVKARRDAQELCSICFEAQRAGVNMVTGTDVASTLQNLLQGGQSSTGRTFKVVGMSNEEAAAAAKYLHVEGGTLVVDLTPGA